MPERIGTTIEHDPMLDKAIPGVLNAASVRRENQTVPKHLYGHNDTTIYNPKRNDPEVEKVLSEHRYNPRKSPDSPEELRRKSATMENELATVKAQMAALLAAISSKPEPAQDAVQEDPVAEEEEVVPVKAPQRRSGRRSTR